MDFNFGLYPVITEEFCNNRSMAYVLEQIIDGGAKIVQLRQKSSSKKELYELAIIYRNITYKHGVKMIIDDHLDVAMAVQADGVHLGQTDLPCKAARELAPNLIIGVSTHNEQEIRKAESDGATYINIGPIFPTKTKETGILPLGLEYLKSVKTNLPFSVMGGIKKANIEELLELGVKNIAMVTEITMADNISKSVSDIIGIINNWDKLNNS